MPRTIDQVKAYEARCDRVAAASKEMTAMCDAADKAEDGRMSPDDGKHFEELGAEVKSLRGEIAGDELQESRRLQVDGLNEDLNRPRITSRRDDPDVSGLSESTITEAMKAASEGRYQLKFFKPRDATLAARHEATRLAYTAGMLFLARCPGSSPVGDWARGKCKAAGINVEALAPVMAEGGNTEGGYLVFPEFEATLIDLKEQYGVYQRDAFTIPMGSDTLTIPRRAGGTTVYYPDENAEITKSSMSYDNVTLTAKKYAQLVRWSTELNEDSVIAMADMLVSEMAYQFTIAEDTNGFIGDGTSTYASTVGVVFKLINTINGITPSASVSTAASGNTTVATLDLADWETAVGILPVYAEPRAKWYMHKTTFWGGPANLMDAAGGNTSALLASGAPPRFLGYDVVFVQTMPTKANITGADANATVSVAALLGDLSMTGYLGMRRGLTVRVSDQRFIEYDQLAITGTQRIAINNVVGDSVAPTTAAGPMIALQCAAS